MERRALLLVCLGCTLLGAGATAHAAAIFLETWSVPDEVAGWQGSSLSLSQSGGTLAWQLAPESTFGIIQADSLSSAGAFVGDVASTGATYYSFSLRPDADTVVTDLTIYLDTPSSCWRYTAALPQSDQWNSYLLPLDTDPGHWVHQLGPETLAQSLTNVSTFMIEIGTLSGGSGQVDNVSLAHTPEPATVCLMLGGIGALTLRRRRSLKKA